MVDLICQRYPGRRPSDVLGLDEWTGFQLNSALAMRGWLEDREREVTYLDEIREMLALLCKVWGAKVSFKKQRGKSRLWEARDDIPDASQVLAGWGGISKGTVVRKGK